VSEFHKTSGGRQVGKERRAIAVDVDANGTRTDRMRALARDLEKTRRYKKERGTRGKPKGEIWPLGLRSASLWMLLGADSSRDI
jgi:hypothetical protein